MGFKFSRIFASQSYTHKTLLFFILALALVRGFLYAAVIPPWQAPDEPAQFERAKAALITTDWNSTSKNPPAWYEDLRDSLLTFEFLNYTLSRLQNGPESSLDRYIDLYQEIYGGTYGSRFTYALIGLPILLIQHHNITLQLYLVRLNMILMSVIIIFLAYLTTRTIFPKSDFLVLGVPTLILFIPQHTHILATVNNGNLAELLATAALYFIARGLGQRKSLPNLGLTLALALAAMWTKATAFFFLFTFSSLGLFYLWRYRHRWPWLLLALILLGSLVYFLAPQRLTLLFSQAWSFLSRRQFYFNPQVISDIFKSFWAMPGWAILRLYPLWYQIWLVVCLLSIVGLAVFLISKWKSLSLEQFQLQKQTLLVFALSIGAAVAIQVGWHVLTGTMLYRQGRSLYPVIVPIAIFLMLGWQQFIPIARQRSGLLAITLVLLLFDSMVLFDYIVPFFYSRY